MKTSINGIHQEVITVPAEGTVPVGNLVALDSRGYGMAAASGEPVGVCVSVNGGYIGVQVKGGVRIPFSGSDLKPGYCQLKALNAGQVGKGTSGAFHLVVSADTGSGIAEILL